MLPGDEDRRREAPSAQAEALRAELNRIKEHRGLSLDSFARDSTISRSTWNRVLKGESFPRRDAIERLCARLKLDSERLLGLWDAADAANKRRAAPGADGLGQANAPAGPQPDGPAGSPAAGAPSQDPAAAPTPDPAASPSPALGEPAVAADLSQAAQTADSGVLPRPDEAAGTGHAEPSAAASTALAEPPAISSPPAADPRGERDGQGGAESVPAVPSSVPAGQTVLPAPAATTEPEAAGRGAVASSTESEGAIVRPGTAGRDRAAVPAAAGAGGEEIAVVRPLTAPAAAPAARTGRVTQLAIVFLTLLVALLLGRWAVMNDSGEDDTATPPATTETQPGDSNGTDDADGAQPSADTPPPADGPTADDGKAEGLQGDGPAAPGDTDSPAPGAPSTGNGTAPPAGQVPSDGTGSTPGTTPTAPAASPTSPAPTTAAPTTAASSLGEEGRTACAHYRPNRRVILAEGMVGTNVAQVQCLLNHNYGYHLDEDGKFGPATTAGVKAVQQCSGITADGKVGPDTWKYLDYPKPACGH